MRNLDADLIVSWAFGWSHDHFPLIELIALQPDSVACWNYPRFDIGGMHWQQKFYLTILGVDLGHLYVEGAKSGSQRTG